MIDLFNQIDLNYILIDIQKNELKGWLLFIYTCEKTRREISINESQHAIVSKRISYLNMNLN